MGGTDNPPIYDSFNRELVDPMAVRASLNELGYFVSTKGAIAGCSLHSSEYCRWLTRWIRLKVAYRGFVERRKLDISPFASRTSGVAKRMSTNQFRWFAVRL
jgi:hypothetical protein